jgi:hypothetical protein
VLCRLVTKIEIDKEFIPPPLLRRWFKLLGAGAAGRVRSWCCYDDRNVPGAACSPRRKVESLGIGSQ